MAKEYQMHARWQGTPTGETILYIRHLHMLLADQSGTEQEVTRQHIAALVRTLRQGGVYGNYDDQRGYFVEEPAGRKPPGKQR